MRISCEIIKDLLPLYHDGICSIDSKALIEEHLVECNSCKVDLQAMKGELVLSHKEQNLIEAEAIKKISKRWKIDMMKSLLKGAIITLLAVAAIAFILYIFMDIRVFPKPY
jgi:predicted anti-sigma-YlaC factor YlaD